MSIMRRTLHLTLPQELRFDIFCAVQNAPQVRYFASDLIAPDLSVAADGTVEGAWQVGARMVDLDYITSNTQAARTNRAE